MFLLRVYWIVLFCVLCALVPRKTLYVLSDEFIDFDSSNVERAGRDFASNTLLDYLNNIMDMLLNKHINYLQKIQYSPDVILSLPQNFDPRDKWPYCPSLNEIRHQGSCGGCWAIAAVEAMTDRYCIKSNGTKHFHFSAEDLLSCGNIDGCNGGVPSEAWDYWQKYGIVSGGNYNSNEGCKPYKIPSCKHSVPGPNVPCNEKTIRPKCKYTCESNYKIKYDNDLRYGKNIFTLKGEDNIKAELYTNGPVEATFDLYSDFLEYKGGVYTHVEGEFIGGHAVKLLGWGVENGTKYWLAANSWNFGHWGKNGFFKIRRGEDHCGIESGIVAGEPILEGEEIEVKKRKRYFEEAFNLIIMFSRRFVDAY